LQGNPKGSSRRMLTTLLETRVGVGTRKWKMRERSPNVGRID
jgi:hypothetical protein